MSVSSTPTAVAQASQGDGEIGRDGGLAHTALATADSDDILHAGQQLFSLWTRLRPELGLNGHLHILSAVVLNGSLGSLDGGLQERVSVPWKEQYDFSNT